MPFAVFVLVGIDSPKHELHYCSDIELKIGRLVVVPVLRRLAFGIVVRCVPEITNVQYTVKKVSSVTDLQLNPAFIGFLYWFARFNFTHAGVAFKYFLPGSLCKVLNKESGPRTRCHNGLQSHSNDDATVFNLNEEQSDALNIIARSAIPVLLYGVTGSGKTYVYAKYILSVLQSGKQVLVMLSEVFLVEKMHQTLTPLLGCKIGIWTSKVTYSSKAIIWRNTLNGSLKVVIGTRSAIFLPFSCLACVIIDEEHDPSYQESSRLVRYNGRDMAIKLAQIHSAKAALVSATPSLETFLNVKNNKYNIAKLYSRHMGYSMPDIQIYGYNLAESTALVSESVLSDIKNAMSQNCGVLVFLNRKGYEKILSCGECGYLYMCDTCSVFMTFSIEDGSMVCNKCDARLSFNKHCVACNSTKLKYFGVGIEKVREFICKSIKNDPELSHKVVKLAYRDGDMSTVSQFQNGEVDLLVSTQIVSKCLTFKTLSLVVLLDIDFCLHGTEFRAVEEAYSLIHQVTGRAGRTGKPSRAIISTTSPDNENIKRMSVDSYFDFAEYILEQRSKGMLPPVNHLILFEIRHKEEGRSLQVAEFLVRLLKNEGVTLHRGGTIGPFRPASRKVRNQYLYRVMLQGYTLTLSNNQRIKGIIDTLMVRNKLTSSNVAINLNPRLVYH